LELSEEWFGEEIDVIVETEHDIKEIDKLIKTGLGLIIKTR